MKKEMQSKVERIKEEIKPMRMLFKACLYLSVTPYFLTVLIEIFGADESKKFEVIEPVDYLYLSGILLWFICFLSLSNFYNKKVQNKIEELR